MRDGPGMVGVDGPAVTELIDGMNAGGRPDEIATPHCFTVF